MLGFWGLRVKANPLFYLKSIYKIKIHTNEHDVEESLYLENSAFTDQDLKKNTLVTSFLIEIVYFNNSYRVN